VPACAGLCRFVRNQLWPQAARLRRSEGSLAEYVLDSRDQETGQQAITAAPARHVPQRPNGRALPDVLGGPDYEVTYPNGDRAAYVAAVYEAEIISGAPAVADGELSDLAWFSPAELTQITLSRLPRALLRAVRRI
jgi:hypothetical protein